MNPRASRLVAATALLLCLGVAPALADETGTSADSSTANTPAKDSPPVLPRQMHGPSAIKALGSNLSTVAARNDLSASRLTKIMSEDSTAWLSAEGQMFYVESPLALDVSPGSTDAGSASTNTATKPAYPTSQTFLLHSRPSATKQIFLDFDGVDLINTGWNTGTNAVTSGTYTGYDSDGNTSTFSTAEQAWIQEVWRQVAETYAPFDIDVTTQDEGAGARTRSSSADNTYGTQVVFSNSTQAVAQACNSTCLGIAWVGTFSDIDPTGYYQPAWVFTTKTMSATIAAQGAAHEAGHTLGLHHDGTQTSAYYPGTKAWGPVMGSATTRALTQFSQGEYAGANNTEDDLAIMQANGAALRPDDYGNTIATADQLGAQPSYAVNGVISTRNDADVFAINLHCSTNLTVTAQGIGPQTAVDLKLDVLNGSGATVTSSNPASGYSSAVPPVSTGMNASATVPKATGTYYLRVDGVGSGSAAGTGYSDYGSLGQYTLKASGCATPSSGPTTGQGSEGTPPTVKRPSPPHVGKATPGAKGGKLTAVARWTPPTDNGGAPITRYRVLAHRLDAQGRVVASYASAFQKPSVRKTSLTLPKGRYQLVVVAWNRLGASAGSRASNTISAR